MSIRNVAVLRGDGTIRVEERPVPVLDNGMLRIRVRCSLVSPGTELGGWGNLAAQARAGAPAGDSKTFGYSAAGTVEAVADGVTRFRPGDRVAAIGAGYALHADTIVVPHHLCMPLHGDLSFEEGSYAMLLATALHATRRATPTIGEYWLIVGLGLVGQLTGRFLQLSGAFVAGVDQNQFRVDLARKWGLDDSWLNADSKFHDSAISFTRGGGMDGAVIAFGGDADDAMNSTVGLMKVSPDGHPMGTIVTVGWPVFSYSGAIGAMNNIDLRRASRTGPGYHDDEWERGGDYPPVFMRWTTRSNVELCLDLVRRGRIDVGGLTTHRIRLDRVESAIPGMLEKPDEILGVVFCTNEEDVQ